MVQNADDASGKIIKFLYFFRRKRISFVTLPRIFLIPRLLFLAHRTKGKTSPSHGKSFKYSGHTGFHHNLKFLNVIQGIDVADYRQPFVTFQTLSRDSDLVCTKKHKRHGVQFCCRDQKHRGIRRTGHGDILALFTVGNDLLVDDFTVLGDDRNISLAVVYAGGVYQRDL